MASKSTPPASVDMDSSSSPPKTPFEDTTIAKPENSKNAPKTDITDDIDPANEVQGTKLILIHLSVCLCTFLVGLDFNLIATAVPIITRSVSFLLLPQLYGPFILRS